MSEMMHVVYHDPITMKVVGEGHLIRIAKHTDGTMAVVEKDEGSQLRVRRLVLNADGDAEVETTERVWPLASVLEPFASPNDQPGVPQDGRARGFSVSKAERMKAAGQLQHDGGPPKWKINKTSRLLEEIPDTRPLLRFDKTKYKEKREKTKAITLTVTRLDLPLFTGEIELIVAAGDSTEGKPVALSFVNGVATIMLPKDFARIVRIVSQETARLEAPVEIAVVDTEL